VLLAAGLVSVAPVGRERHYQIERHHLGDVMALWLRSIGFDVESSA
jgi:hypothetical protein